jgi:V-type H+-transporting ATPase subunit a
MGSLFRSQEMTLCQLFLHADTAYMCISELGELGVVQFRDSVPDTNAFQRKFVNEIRRCDEMERKLRFLEKEIRRDDLPMLDVSDNPEAPAPREMIDLEATFEKLENELREVNANAEQLRRNLLELTELKHILRKTQGFFDEAMHDPAMNEEQIGLLGEEGLRSGGLGGQGLRLGFVAGVILREKMPTFELMLWRACRGNVFLKQAEIELPLTDTVTNENVYKSVFIIFFQGDQLRSRVKKICEAFHATLYPCPDSQSERREMAIGVMTRIEDLQTVLNQTQEHRQRLLSAAARCIKIWFLKVHKIKAIYHVLNFFNLDVTAKCMIGECWCAVEDLESIHEALKRGTKRSNSSAEPIINRMSTNEDPPTFHRENKFTNGFQAIVDSYGYGKYREINPTPFTMITFPFLFAIMFGDAGHGLIMALFALWMIWREKQLAAQLRKNQSEIFETFYGGRYIIFLMGLFSIYTGLIYNDVFSKSLNIFGSGWYPSHIPLPSNEVKNSSGRIVIPAPSYTLDPKYFGDTYPFGVDPAWQVALNKITFTNGVKMKVSIILGVMHMLFGVFLSLLNQRFFKDHLSVVCEFIPQVIFLVSIFGYLVVLIFVKWIKFDHTQSHTAPSLLIGLIQMFMFNGSSAWYDGQSGMQAFLVVLAIICVPWMLLLKPYILYKRHKNPNWSPMKGILGGPPTANGNASTGGQRHNAETQPLTREESVVHHTDAMNSSTVIKMEGDHGGACGEHFDMTEIFVHQCIHTIEYCLGCISNTASYLRLWALSLAHAQLSEVLWNMVLRIALAVNGFHGVLLLVPIFAFWASLTIFVLLIMEGLSAFLHALRLHWIEFQNKFYAGTGYPFIPFSFEQMHQTITSANRSDE